MTAPAPTSAVPSTPTPAKRPPVSDGKRAMLQALKALEDHPSSHLWRR